MPAHVAKAHDYASECEAYKRVVRRLVGTKNHLA